MESNLPWWGACVLLALMCAAVGLSAWFDYWSKKRLEEAESYWRRASTLWRMLSQAPLDHLTDQQLTDYAAQLDRDIASSQEPPHV